MSRQSLVVCVVALLIAIAACFLFLSDSSPSTGLESGDGAPASGTAGTVAAADESSKTLGTSSEPLPSRRFEGAPSSGAPRSVRLTGRLVVVGVEGGREVPDTDSSSKAMFTLSAYRVRGAPIVDEGALWRTGIHWWTDDSARGERVGSVSVAPGSSWSIEVDRPGQYVVSVHMSGGRNTVAQLLDTAREGGIQVRVAEGVVASGSASVSAELRFASEDLSVVAASLPVSSGGSTTSGPWLFPLLIHVAAGGLTASSWECVVWNDIARLGFDTVSMTLRPIDAIDGLPILDSGVTVSSSPGRTGGRWTVGDPFRHGDSDSIVVSVPRSDPPVWLDDIRLLVTAPGYVPVDIWQPEQLVDEGGQMTVPMVRSRVARTRIIEDGGSVVANGTACVMIVVSGSRTPFRGTTDEEGFLSLSPTGQLHTGPGMVGSIHPPSWSPVLGSTARQDVPLVLRLDGSRGQIYFSKFSWGDHVKGNAELIVPRIVERVTLRVMDAASDQPITGAVTTVAPSIGGGTPMDPWVSATTDAAGEAVLGDLAEGKWAVTVTSTGFAALSADLDVSLGSDPYVLRLSSISQHALRVITPDGHPLDAANVALRSESGHRATGVTNQEGVVTLDVLAEAPYWAFIHTPDRKWQSDRFIPPTVVFGAKEGVVDVIVQPKRSLRVTVLVDEGRRGGARLLGTRSGAFDERLGPAYGLTNAKGEATLTVPGTPMTVQAIVADRMPGSAEWDGVTTTLDLRLDNLGTRVRGKLRSLDQGFAIRATLLRPEGVDAASRMNWTDHVVTATADAEGTFEFTSLCPGDWEFAVVGTDGATKLRTANLQVSGAVMNCTL